MPCASLRLVAGKVGTGARAHPQTAQLATARALAGRASALVYVQSEIAKGDLRTTIDVYPSMANAWDRIRNPLPSPIGHSFASAKVDVEVRSFTELRSCWSSPPCTEAKHEEEDVIAVGCGDADGDGGNEVVLVSRDRVAMGRVRGGVFVTEHAAPWAELGQRVPVPMREPLGGAAIVLGGVDVGTSDRGGIALTPDFVGHSLLAGIPAAGGRRCESCLDGAALGREPFDGAPFDCAALTGPQAKDGRAVAPVRRVRSRVGRQWRRGTRGRSWRPESRAAGSA